MDFYRRPGPPLNNILAVTGLIVIGGLGALIGLVAVPLALPRPSDEMIENLSKSGFSALDKVRYGRLQEKITKISARLINGANGAISDSEKAELECAKKIILKQHLAHLKWLLLSRLLRYGLWGIRG